jgi:cytochrome P450
VRRRDVLIVILLPFPRYVGGVAIEAGSDTTASIFQSLVLLMTAFPEAQKKAHEELDRVVGRDRLPTLADMDNLPYVDAVLKEVILVL